MLMMMMMIMIMTIMQLLNWHIKSHYSSWCTFTLGATKQYGMINCLFRFPLPSDPLLNGLPFADISSWKIDKELQRLLNINRISFSSDNSTSVSSPFDPNVAFVPVFNLHSTVVLSAPTITSSINKGLKQKVFNVYQNRRYFLLIY